MRKVSQTMAHALLNGRPATVGNTHTDGATLYLHGNAIAHRHRVSGLLSVSLAGWPTATTRERLNALPGVRIVQRDGVQYLNGERIDASGWYVPTVPGCTPTHAPADDIPDAMRRACLDLNY